ncbi:hypothetical protein PR048_005293 [Dryococelus australis]|uniref:Uncharacterized protein n=1 Tax=Dryococelus australis TaxID=614101 RepID=A0ABQ9I7S5_9NEOP|nr:hypothetical protein PR048_005293 [Dryococelus australis]
MTDGNFGDALSDLLKRKAEMEDGGGLTYQGISLSHCSSIDTLKYSYNDVLTQLHDVVYKRFSDLHENDLIKFGMKILHEINFLCTHYKKVLEEKDIRADGECAEWKSFKTFWLSNLRHIKQNLQ